MPQTLKLVPRTDLSIKFPCGNVPTPKATEVSPTDNFLPSALSPSCQATCGLGGMEVTRRKGMAQRAGGWGRAEEERRWVGRPAFSHRPTSCRALSQGSQTGFIQESRLSPVPAPCLPTHRTPLGWGLFFTFPKSLLSKPHGHSEMGSPRACRQTDSTSQPHPVEQTSILRINPIVSSGELHCERQEGPWCAVTDDLDPTAFPFQRGFSQAGTG